MILSTIGGALEAIVHNVNQVSIDSLSSLQTALTQIKAHDPGRTTGAKGEEDFSG
jgi:hypothetical protein